MIFQDLEGAFYMPDLECDSLIDFNIRLIKMYLLRIILLVYSFAGLIFR